LQSRFEEYCDGHGSSGFEAWDTLDYQFRQRLKRTQDPELKRLYVLSKLHMQATLVVSGLENTVEAAGHGGSPPMTPSELHAAQQRILELIEELAAYTSFTNFATASRRPLDIADPAVNPKWVEELRARLRSLTSNPAANPQGEANGRQPSSSVKGVNP
jgi:hypothetical protein